MAQGEDPFDIAFTYYDPSWEHGRLGNSVATTWNQILAVVGPLMFYEALEHSLERAVDSYVEDRFRTPNVRAIQVKKECFQTIKVQMIALGIMRKSERKKPPSDIHTYWQLTPYGEHYVTTLKAVRRVAGAPLT